ncbi:protein lin-28 homolog A [Aplochiton taeniatus]
MSGCVSGNTNSRGPLAFVQGGGEGHPCEGKWVNGQGPWNTIGPASGGGPCCHSKSKLHMEGFRSLKEGEEVEFTFKKSSKGLESQRVSGPGGIHCLGSERRPKGKSVQKRRSKGDRCYNCGGLDHHAKECKLPPQPKKCHFCQSISHMVANCSIRAQQSSPGSQGKPDSLKGDLEEQSLSPVLPEPSN